MKNKLSAWLLLGSLFSIILFGCSGEPSDENTLRVGTVVGPDVILLETAGEVAKERFDLNIQIIAFEDYNTPNIALNDGEIEANMFQHQPFLDEVNAARGYTLVAAGRTFVFPMGLYSAHIDTLEQLQQGATIAIPVDPSNGARALLLLQDAGLITLDESKGAFVNIPDITANPMELQIQELDAAQLPRVLTDVDAAVINNNYAAEANLTLTDDAIYVEQDDSPYANIVAVRLETLGDPRIDELVEALHSREVLQTAQTLFSDVVPAW